MKINWNMDVPVPQLLRQALVLYGRLVRFFLHRVTAVWFMVLGSLMTIMDTLWVLMGKLVDAHGQPSSFLAKLIYILLPLLITLVGWILWRTNSWWDRSNARSKNPWE